MGIMLGFLLFIIAYILYLPLTILNFFMVWSKGYFRDSGLTLDRLANREFRTLFDKTLIQKDGYKFGNIEETISGVLGVNILKNKLSRTGKVLVWILSEKHCIDAIIINPKSN
ncbi:MAG: hypothetical protein ABI441_10910 [Flavobacterium sp.]